MAQMDTDAPREGWNYWVKAGQLWARRLALRVRGDLAVLLVLLVVMVVIGVTLRRHPVAAPRPTKRPAPRGVPVGRYKRTSAPAEDDADATSPPTTEKIVPEESGETVALVSATPVPTVDDAASTSLNDPYELRPAAVGSRVNAEFLRSRLCPPLWQLYSQSAIMPGSALALWMPALLPFFDEAVVADKAQPLPSSAEAGDAAATRALP